MAFLQAALAHYQSLGIAVSRVMTENGACYKSRALLDRCQQRGLKHIRTKPDTRKTNGKAERFIQTSLRERAHARAYETSDQRGKELPYWLHQFNWHRPHSGMSSQTPISRL